MGHKKRETGANLKQTGANRSERIACFCCSSVCRYRGLPHPLNVLNQLFWTGVLAEQVPAQINGFSTESATVFRRVYALVDGFTIHPTLCLDTLNDQDDSRMFRSYDKRMSCRTMSQMCGSLPCKAPRLNKL
jgi:hypothetical protein